MSSATSACARATNAHAVIFALALIAPAHTAPRQTNEFKFNNQPPSSRRAHSRVVAARAPRAPKSRPTRVGSFAQPFPRAIAGARECRVKNARVALFFLTQSQQHRLRSRHSPPHARAHAIAHGCHARAHTAATQRTRLRTRAHHRGTSAAIGRGAHRIDRRRCGAAALTVD